MPYTKKYDRPYCEKCGDKNYGEDYNDRKIKGNPGIYQIAKHVYRIKRSKMAGKGFRYGPMLYLVKNRCSRLNEGKQKCGQHHYKHLCAVKAYVFSKAGDYKDNDSRGNGS